MARTKRKAGWNNPESKRGTKRKAGQEQTGKQGRNKEENRVGTSRKARQEQTGKAGTNRKVRRNRGKQK